MSSIFISHSSIDKEISIELGRRLEEKDHPSVFLDLDPEKGIVAGQSWERTLYRKLRSCRAVIAVCTDNYLSSHWCFAEIALARMEGKHIIALQVDPLSADARMPAILSETQFIDMRADPEEGYRRLWKGLSEKGILGVDSDWDKSESPYLGLNAFQEEHAPLFFGREDETRAGLELLGRGSPGLIMVIGASGTGKSSLVRAGMIPRLRKEKARWLVVEPFRPGADPFGELATSLERAYKLYAPQHGTGDWQKIRDELVKAADLVARNAQLKHVTPESDQVESRASDDDRADDRVARLVKQLEELRENPPDRAGDRLRNFLDWSIEDLSRIDRGLAPTEAGSDEAPGDRTALIAMTERLRRLVPGRRSAHVLLVIDQFEELLGHDEPDHPANRFLELLRASVESEHSPLIVLGTMRSDFLGSFQRNLALRGIDFESLSLGSMRIEGMREIIEEPARLGAIVPEKGFADRLLEDTETPDALPLLSFTLWKLWQDYGSTGKLTVEQYKQLGGLAGAVASEADAVLKAAVDAGKEDALRTALLRMARLTEDGRFARRAVRWDDEELLPAHTLLETLVERRLLAKDAKGDVTMVEVTHEALFRSWAPLRGWLDNHRAEMTLLARIERDAAIWDEGKRDPETLWRGARLQQAFELMARRARPKVEEDFVAAGVSRRRRRVRTVTGVTAAVFAALASLTAVSYGLKLRADDERSRALDLARVSIASERLAENANVAALILLELENPEQTGLAALKMREAINAGLSIVLRGDEADIPVAAFSPDGSRVVTGNTFGRAHVMNADGTGMPVVFDEHVAAITDLAFSPDGSRVVTASRDGPARVWDASTGALLATLAGDGAEVLAVAFSPDGRRVAVASKEVRVWNADGSGIPTVFAGHTPHSVWSAAFSPDGRRLVTASEDGTARVWSMDASVEPVVLRGHSERVTAATFSPDGDRVVTASYDGTARVWTIDGSLEPVVLSGHAERVTAAAFSPDGGLVVTSSIDNTVRVWRADGSGEPMLLTTHGDRVVAVVFSPDGNRVLTASHDGTARVLNADGTGEPVVLTGHTNAINVAVFDPAGQRVLTASQDGTARVWHSNGRSDPVLVRRFAEPAEAAAFTEGGSRVAMVSTERQRQVTLWSLAGTGEATVVTLTRQRRQVTSVRFSPDGTHLVTVDVGGGVGVWNTDPGAAPFVPPWGSAPITAVGFSPDGASLASASRDETVRVWRTSGTADESPPTPLGEHRNVSAVTFSPDGSQVVTTSGRGTVKLWNAAGGGELSMFGDTAGPQVIAATFAPAAEPLMTVSADGTVKLWDPLSGDFLTTLGRPQGGLVTSATFSPDGARVVTVSEDGTAHIWNASGTGDPVVLKDDGLSILAATFSSDGRYVFTISDDGTLMRWATITHELLAEALASSTGQCLEPDVRERYLGESSAEAEARYGACETEHGRGG